MAVKQESIFTPAGALVKHSDKKIDKLTDTISNPRFDQLSLPDKVRQLVKRYTLNSTTLNQISKINQFIFRLRDHCKTDKDHNIFTRLIKHDDYEIFELYSPQQAELSIHNIISMAKIGIKVGCLDPIKIEAHKNGHYSVFHIIDAVSNQKIEIFDTNWDETYRCALHPRAYPKLFEARKQIAQDLKKKFGHLSPEAISKSKRLMARHIEKNVSSEVWKFKVPTEGELANPEEVELQTSLFLTDEGKIFSSFHAQDGLRVIQLQRLGKLPSIFRSTDQEKFEKNRFNFLFLLSMDASMSERDFFKKSHYASVQTKLSIKKYFPHSQVSFLPYQDNPLTIEEDYKEFVQPEGTAAVADPIEKASQFFMDKKGANFVIHLCSSKLKRIPEACQRAKELSQKGINYHQILFGYNATQLAQQLQARVLKSVEATFFDELEERLTGLSEAANGGHTTLWISKKMTKLLVSVVDLLVGTHFYRLNTQNLRSISIRSSEEIEDDLLDMM